jgi:hypothetical protein
VGQERKEWHEKVKEMALKRPEEKHWNWLSGADAPRSSELKRKK